MSREPMAYGVAGVIFGFVLGYMAANTGGVRPAASAAPFPAAASGGSAAAPARPAPVLDPNEVRALESLAARDAKNAEARVELGNLLMDHERFEDAVRWYQEALAIDPSNSDVRVDMGACFVSLHRPEEAIAAFEEALKRTPGHKKALFNKGIALMEAGRPKEAVALWEDLLKRYPDDPQLQGLRGQVAQVKASAGMAKP